MNRKKQKLIEIFLITFFFFIFIILFQLQYFVKSRSLKKKSSPNKIIIEMIKKISKKMKYKKFILFGRIISIISVLKRKLIVKLATKSITITKD